MESVIFKSESEDLVFKFNKNHDKTGRFSSSKGSGGSDEDANPEYRYHSTSFRNAASIAETELRPSIGQYGIGVYFAPNVEGTKGWTSDAKEQVPLRVKHKTLVEQYGYGEFPEQGITSEKPVHRKDIKIKTHTGEWKPINETLIYDTFAE